VCYIISSLPLISLWTIISVFAIVPGLDFIGAVALLLFPTNDPIALKMAFKAAAPAPKFQ